MSARLSVVVPAHNESAVVARLLRPLLPGVDDGELEIVVAANGCTDDTADIVRSLSPQIRLVELTAASKSAALNAADSVATVFPRAYVDADVVVSRSALLALAEQLSAPGGPLVAAPPLRVDTSRSSWSVRAHYRIWELTDYRRHGHVGSGIYALSRAGRSRFGDFPDIIADDRFVQRLFAGPELGSAGEHFTVFAPRTLRALVRRSVRAAAGNAQLRDAGIGGTRSQPDESTAATSVSHLAAAVGPRPRLWPAFAIYCLCYLAPRVLARRKRAAGLLHVWERDETSRA